MSSVANTLTIARREILVRVRTRTYLVGTLLLVLGVLAVSMAPRIVAQFDRVNPTRIAVAAADRALAASAAATLGALLNGPLAAGQPGGAGGGAGSDAPPPYDVVAVDDVAQARAAVLEGTYGSLLALDRDTAGDLAFTFFTDDPATGRTVALVRQAASSIVVADRLNRLGVAPADQATLFTPADFTVAWPDPDRAGVPQGASDAVGRDLLSFGMTILIFMIVIMYGNWIAVSVAEEKSSRVMEVVLNAATPLELLAGKVLGVGTAAMVQFAAVVATGAAAMLAGDPLADLLLGQTGASAGVTSSLSPGLLAAFAAYGVLGFLLYASLFAAAGSLVSRQEDVSTAVMPLTLLATLGYMVGSFAVTGALDLQAGWLVVLGMVPFLSPFMMLGRIASGVVTPLEVGVSLGLLVVVLLGAIWIAARIYAVGVLMYGSWPGWRSAWRLLRQGM